MNGNNLSRYEDIRTLADRVVNSALMKITNTERRTKNLGSSTRAEGWGVPPWKSNVVRS
nr:12107_t:CDS:2 [Entrophospora candida]